MEIEVPIDGLLAKLYFQKFNDKMIIKLTKCRCIICICKTFASFLFLLPLVDNIIAFLRTRPNLGVPARIFRAVAGDCRLPAPTHFCTCISAVGNWTFSDPFSIRSRIFENNNNNNNRLIPYSCSKRLNYSMSQYT